MKSSQLKNTKTKEGLKFSNNSSYNNFFLGKKWNYLKQIV